MEENSTSQSEGGDSTNITNVNSDESLFDPSTVMNNNIFRDKKKVQIGWVPDGNRIVGRMDYITEISSYINDAVFGEKATHVSITGKTGTGKSLVSKYVTQRARKESPENVTLGVASVDCSKSSTEIQIISTIGQQLNDDSFWIDKDEDVYIPDIGLPKDKFYKRFWKVMDNYNSAIIILDEINLVKDNNILLHLAKASENQDTTCNIGLIAISNDIRYFDSLDGRIKSVFHAEQMNFDPYNADDLQKILQGRLDAFVDGVVEDEVIPYISALAAREHGDSRKAMRLFRKAGEVAQKNKADSVTPYHVNIAKDEVVADRFRDYIEGSTHHMQITSLALASHYKFEDKEYVFGNDLYDTYCDIAHEIGSNSISNRGFRDILQDFELNNIIEKRKRNENDIDGRKNTYRLLLDADVIFEVIFSDSSFEPVNTKGILSDFV